MPAIRSANDAFWHSIRANLGAGPAELDRNSDFWAVWRSPDLLFSQTCGYPFRAELHPIVQLVGTPDYGLDGCPPGHYCSVFVAHADDERRTLEAFEGAEFGYNEPMSQSGWAAPIHHMRKLGLTFASGRQTGGHALSARAVARSDVDIAALDQLTFELLRDHDPDLCAQLKVVARTEPTPTLPYITSAAQDPREIARAVGAAIADLSPQNRAALRLRGLVDIPARAYLDVATPPTPGALFSEGR